MPAQPLPTAFRENWPRELRRAAAWHELPAFVASDFPLADDDGRGQAWRSKVWPPRIFSAGTVAQGDFHRFIRIGLRWQRHQGFTSVGAGVHRFTIDLGFPQCSTFRQRRPQGAAAARFHKKAGVGHPLTIARDLAG